jgi:c-di-GMP-binding flagellar brake protein YcgR
VEYSTGPREFKLNVENGPDKRRYLRYDILDYVTLTLDSTHNPINAVIVDISLGGLQLRSREHLPAGRLCTIRVGCADLPPLSIRGEVRHSSPVPDSDLFATGIRFMPESHADRMAIAEYVHEVFQRQCDELMLP